MTKRIPILFVIPSLFFYIAVKIYPMLQSLFYSFTDSNGFNPDYNFVGFSNFVKLFSDDRFLNSIRVTLTYVIVVVTVVNLLALIIAVLLNRSSILTKFLRSTYFIPALISQVAIAYIWKNIYSYNGILNYILNIFHIEKLGWLSDPDMALLSLCIVGIWRILGYHMVIILAALQTIPGDVYEAASIDGAGPFAKFRHVTLPLVMPGLSISIILATIGTMKQFDIVKVLTDGGPLNATDTISYFIIDSAFNYNMQGYATAAGMILLIMVILVTAIQNGWLSGKEVKY